MFIEVSFGQNMTQLFNINVTNNILLDHIKNSLRSRMLEELEEKENLAKSTINELSQDLERTENINGKAENPEEDSENVKDLKQSIEKWTGYLDTTLTPYLKIMRASKGLSIDLMDESGNVVDLSYFSKKSIIFWDINSFSNTFLSIGKVSYFYMRVDYHNHVFIVVI